MPGAQTGSPMTFMLDGKQYVIVAASSSISPGELIAYKLP
jgi:quinoprotein glucose dehydrogenase